MVSAAVIMWLLRGYCCAGMPLFCRVCHRRRRAPQGCNSLGRHVCGCCCAEEGPMTTNLGKPVGSKVKGQTLRSAAEGLQQERPALYSNGVAPQGGVAGKVPSSRCAGCGSSCAPSVRPLARIVPSMHSRRRRLRGVGVDRLATTATDKLCPLTGIKIARCRTRNVQGAVTCAGSSSSAAAGAAPSLCSGRWGVPRQTGGARAARQCWWDGQQAGPRGCVGCEWG